MLTEKSTDEYRVVKHYLFGVLPLWVTAVQRKWLVQSGKMYSPADFGPPDSPQDVFVDVIEGRPMWQPMKEEWRDLASVSQKEAKNYE